MPEPRLTIAHPCQETCSHEDCEVRRGMAVQRCVYCLATIGYGRDIAYVGNRLAHAACAENVQR